MKYIRRLPFSKHPAFRVSPSLEGYSGYVFGMAGLNCSAKNVAHELAHAVEFGSENFRSRCSKEGEFIFKLPRKYFGGRAYFDIQTDQAVLREARVIGIQWHFESLMGVPLKETTYIETALQLCGYLPGYELCSETKLIQTIFETRDKYSPDLVIKEVTAWLDKTQRRLMRNKQTLPDQESSRMIEP